MTEDTMISPDDATIETGASPAAAGTSEAETGAPGLADEVVRLNDEVAALKDRLLRAAAETENVRRRLEREKADASTYAMTGFARDLLGVADNLARAVAALPAEAPGFEAVKTGIAATERELTSVLARHGISRVASDGKLDPNRHQAMLEVDSEHHEPGSIVAELQAGYTIKDRLLRPALVSVAKARGDAA
jgi:molecular chaperone GrpE